MISDEYLYRINSREQITRWVIALRFFRFIRASGGSLNDSDLLEVRLRCTDAAERAQLLAKLDVPPDIILPSVVTINGVRVSVALVPDGMVLMVSDAIDPYTVSDAAVMAAQKVEEKLVPLTPWLVDPPEITSGCICPQRYPEFWPPRFQYSWPLQWHLVFLLLPVAAFFFLLASFVDELLWMLNIVCALLGLLVLTGAIAGMVKTTITVDAYGDFVLQHHLFIFTLFRQQFAAQDIVQVELKTIPVEVAPGRHPRYTHALRLVHRHGVQPIHQDDDIMVLEKPAKKLADVSGYPLVYR
ncbi:hypothetical protein BST81_08185 [Leptolyngbya sp. 'hensonii']|uniref:hypothetical protein n=1 Tax=Leptolyngbya sp. 'hensonii' TaxID=1922337 RepID=UPI00094FCBC1|nr:hypothetical protein [Leptolyngbya sp. 'hensonii']OLP18884.1 hypothetical protein BST81_08185 [Leptolyngbya sp. 'hensonii']